MRAPDAVNHSPSNEMPPEPGGLEAQQQVERLGELGEAGEALAGRELGLAEHVGVEAGATRSDAEQQAAA